MSDFTNLATDWLAGHPNPAVVTDDPIRWTEQTGEAIFQRAHALVAQLAPPIDDEPFPERVRRMNSAWAKAKELAIDEYLPFYEPTTDTAQDWTPLVPDISDLL